MLADSFKISHILVLIFVFALRDSQSLRLNSALEIDDSLTYVWPLPAEFTSGNDTLSVDPGLSFAVGGNGENSSILRAAFDRYRRIVFKHSAGVSVFDRLRGRRSVYDISKLKVIVNSYSEEVSCFD